MNKKLLVFIAIVTPRTMVNNPIPWNVVVITLCGSLEWMSSPILLPIMIAVTFTSVPYMVAVRNETLYTYGFGCG
jgi:hypothetical protein